MDDQTTQLDKRLAAVEKDTAVIKATLAAQSYVTKEDFVRLEGRVMVIQSNYSTKEDLARIDARIFAIEADYATREDLAKLESHMIKWYLGSAASICTVIISVLKLWP